MTWGCAKQSGVVNAGSGKPSAAAAMFSNLIGC